MNTNVRNLEKFGDYRDSMAGLLDRVAEPDHLAAMSRELDDLAEHARARSQRLMNSLRRIEKATRAAREPAKWTDRESHDDGTITGTFRGQPYVMMREDNGFFGILHEKMGIEPKMTGFHPTEAEVRAAIEAGEWGTRAERSEQQE